MDGVVSPQDALYVINELNSVRGAHPYNAFDFPDRWLDVDFDGWVSPIDALKVINGINEHGGSFPFVLECPSAHLSVVVRDIGDTDTAVSNARNELFYRFEARAGGDDLLVTGAAFQAEVGDLLNITNAKWWVDTDGNGATDTVLQGSVTSVDGMLTFDNLSGGYVVPENETVLFEIRADVASSLVADNHLRLGMVDGSFTAEEVQDGAPLASSQIDVATTPSLEWTFVPSGSLYIGQSTTPIRPQYVLGGALSDVLLSVDMRSVYETADVTKFFVSARGASVQSIDRLELYKVGETLPFATATIAGVGTDSTPSGFTTFAANMQNRQLVIPEGQAVTVQVRARMKADDVGAVSNEPIQLWVHGSFQSVVARGDESSNNYAANDGDAVDEGEVFIGTASPGANQDVVGTTHNVVMAMVTSVANANPDADNTNIPTGMYPVGQFKYTAAANSNTLNGLNKVVLDKLVFIIDASNVQLDPINFRLFNKADATQKVAPWAIAQSGNLYHLTFLNLATSVIDTSISSGSSITLALQVDVSNPLVNPAEEAHLQVFAELGEGNLFWLDQDFGGSKNHDGLRLPDNRIGSTKYRN